MLAACTARMSLVKPGAMPVANTELLPWWQVPVSESTRSWSRGVIQIQLMVQAIGVWVHLQTAAYSAGVR